MREIKEIIIHCTATPLHARVTKGSIYRAHVARGFKGIGYHFIINYDGEIWECRDIEQQGAHCLGHNENSIGIAYIGGLDMDGKPFRTLTEEQEVALIGLLDVLKAQFPEATIHGHNEFSNKACPCFDVQEWLKGVGL